MSSSGRPPAQPRALSVRVHRLTAAFVAIVVLPLTLTACGLLGGGGEDAAPVVIPSEAVDDGSAAMTATPSETPAASDTAVVSTDAADQAPVNETVTMNSTVVQVQKQTRTKTATATATATKTLPQVTVTKTPAPVTTTETETRTKTKTETKTDVKTVITTCRIVPPSTVCS